MNEEQYIGFESYSNNEMPQEEKILFEEKLQSDAEFRQSFELYKETTQFLNAKFSTETSNFKENLTEISKNYFENLSSSETQKPSKVISFKPWHYSIAASIVLFIGIFFFMQNETPEYSDYNEHETAVFVERSTANENLKDAQDFFNAKEYEKAVQAFEKIEDFTNTELRYFYGISLIETSDYVKGELFLSNIKSGNSAYKDKATWNLALSKLKQKQYKECKDYLNQIPSDAEDFDKAQQLLHDLD